MTRFYFYHFILFVFFLFAFFTLLFLLSACYSHFDYFFFLPPWGTVYFLFSFFLFLLILISLSLVMFQKLFMSVLLFALFVSVFGFPSMFVSIRVLHSSFSFSFLQQCSIGLCPSLNCWSFMEYFLVYSKHSNNSNCFVFIALIVAFHSFASYQIFLFGLGPFVGVFF